MATVLSPGDIAIVQYNSTTTDSFSFVFLRDVEAGTNVNFTDNGWLAAGGFRPGEGTVTYTAPGRDYRRYDRHADRPRSRCRRRPDHRLSGRSRRPRPSSTSSTLPTATTPSPATRPTPTPRPCRPASRSASTRSRSHSTIRSMPARSTDLAAELFAAHQQSRPTGSTATALPQSPAPFSLTTGRTSISTPTIRRMGAATIGQRSSSGGPAVQIADADIDISDLDGTEITQARDQSQQPGSR